MKDFIHRTIGLEKEVVDEDGERVKMSVSRTHTSAGYAAIKATFGKSSIEFNISGEYEQHARQFAEMLLEIARNPCKLPEVES